MMMRMICLYDDILQLFCPRRTTPLSGPCQLNFLVVAMSGNRGMALSATKVRAPANPSTRTMALSAIKACAPADLSTRTMALSVSKAPGRPRAILIIIKSIIIIINRISLIRIIIRIVRLSWSHMCTPGVASHEQSLRASQAFDADEGSCRGHQVARITRGACPRPEPM